MFAKSIITLYMIVKIIMSKILTKKFKTSKINIKIYYLKKILNKLSKILKFKPYKNWTILNKVSNHTDLYRTDLNRTDLDNTILHKVKFKSKVKILLNCLKLFKTLSIIKSYFITLTYNKNKKNVKYLLWNCTVLWNHMVL